MESTNRNLPEEIIAGTEEKTNTAPKHFSLFSDFDIELFKAGKHYRLYEKMGAHIAKHEGKEGTYFAVWAPNAKYLSVIGDFNGWNRSEHPLNIRWDGSGIWETFVPGVQQGTRYKYFLESHNGQMAEKGDPYAFHWETPPLTASSVWGLDYKWTDKKWLAKRKEQHALGKPLNVYELHPGSWKRKEGNAMLSYKEMAESLPDYCKEMGFTHVEFMPVMEHPFYGSWGYQITGYFAPSSRFGTPQDFMFLVDALHNAGIGVILDWVPSHFPGDVHGLYHFDGTHLYEHADPRKGFHPDWQSYIFNYGRNEVRAFLISNALYWLDKYHIDGLRVDAVASMLYLDYSRKEGEWERNHLGGRENLEAVSFLQEFNEAVHTYHADTITIAEESTAFPGVTHPVSYGGLGFDAKWMMGWMNDTLDYFSKDPVYRAHHQQELIFSLVYAFSERFVLPLSHDEVVYGKHSLLRKMPGDEWQQFANLRLLFGCMYGHPGGKMIFMGGEFGQAHEWRHDFSLDWHEAEQPLNSGLMKLIKALNALSKKEPALYELNFSDAGFEWIDHSDTANSVISWTRKGHEGTPPLIFVANLTPTVLHNYCIGVPDPGSYKEVLSSDEAQFGGSGIMNPKKLKSAPKAAHGRENSIVLSLPPLGISVLKKG